MAGPIEPGQQPGVHGAALPFAGCVYSLMLGAGLLWLGMRGAMAEVQAQAIGRHSLLASAAVGLGGGLAASGALWLAARWSAAVRKVELRVAAVLGPMDETRLCVFALLAAVAEELFFRLAAQDALGWPLAVAFYVAVNTGPGFLAWIPIALGAGLLFSGMVAAGFGLLSATAAHAVVNYLSLRRILPS